MRMVAMITAMIKLSLSSWGQFHSHPGDSNGV
jgi:hypothetical protein